MNGNQEKSNNEVKYKYLPSPKELENFTGEFQRPSILTFMKENFIVVIGIGITVSALVNGLRHLVRGDSEKQQYMMRWRVGGQGFAVLALIGTACYKSLYEKNKKL